MPIRVVFLMLTTVLLSACSSVLPPIQSMSDARLAVKAAWEARVQDYMPASMAYIERRLQQAEAELASGPHAYQFAHFNAVVVKEEAVRAHKIAVQLRHTEDALKVVEALGYTWRDTENLLNKAKSEARLGSLDKALNFAQQAEQQAVQAQQQAYLEHAKFELQRWQQVKDLSTSQQQHLQKARQAVQSARGEKALGHLRVLMDAQP